ncbi:MAG: hypothetical protein ACRC5A_16290 [Enterobacteriaceae bacterium]
MKKSLLSCTVIAPLVLFSHMALSAQTATFTIDGHMPEAPCDIIFTVPNIHVGAISRNILGTGAVVVPGIFTTMLQITCPAPANAAVTIADGSPAPIHSTVKQTGANFAFGYQSGYYVTVSLPQVGTNLTPGSLDPAQLKDNSVSGGDDDDEKNKGVASITNLKNAGFQWLMKDGSPPSGQQFRAQFQVFPVMPPVTVLPSADISFFGSVVATVNFAA